jgi:hypothetical protein
MFHELLWRDREDGRATWQPQGVGSEAYLNGTRGRQEGRPYPWSQQAIHKIFGLKKEVAVKRGPGPQIALGVPLASMVVHVAILSSRARISSFRKSRSDCPESRADEGFLDTPSTSLRVVSLSNIGSRLRSVRHDISDLSLIVDMKIDEQLQ